jgi:hypothetical protein
MSSKVSQHGRTRLTTQKISIMKGNVELGKPAMKYAIAVPGIKVKRPIAVVVRSAKNTASTETVLLALSCLNSALPRLR